MTEFERLREELKYAHDRNNELWRQTLDMLEQAKRPGTTEELHALRRLAAIAADSTSTWMDWHGHASTTQAMVDSMRRLYRALDAAGYPYRGHDALEWRGSILHELNAAGFFYSREKEAFVFDPDAEKEKPYRNHGNAVGPTLAEVAAAFRKGEGP